MKVHSTLLLLFVFSSYHLAESKPEASEDEPNDLKAAIKKLGNGSKAVADAIKTVLSYILIVGEEDRRSADAALTVLNAAPGINGSTKNGVTGTATVAYMDALTSALTTAAEAAKVITGDVVENEVNGATFDIRSLTANVNTAAEEAERVLRSKAFGEKQSAIMALNTLATEQINEVIGSKFDHEPEDYGEDTDKSAIGAEINDLSQAVKRAAGVARKALAVLEG